jgi:hypothetical protein
LFAGFRQTLAELRGGGAGGGGGVSRERVHRSVRVPHTIQEHEAARRDQARLYAGLDSEDETGGEDLADGVGNDEGLDGPTWQGGRS